jgi:hypothetical protein
MVRKRQRPEVPLSSQRKRNKTLLQRAPLILEGCPIEILEKIVSLMRDLLFSRVEGINGASYTALNVILDRAHPGHRINADTILHFGPPAGILLAAETMRGFHFVSMPPSTILLTP